MKTLLEKYSPNYGKEDEAGGDVDLLLGAADDDETNEGEGDVEGQGDEADKQADVADGEKAGGEADGEGDGEGESKDVYDPEAVYEDDSELSTEENAAKKVEFEASQAEKAEKAKDKEVDPSSYKIEAPEDFNIDPDVEKQFREFGAKRKFTQDDMNELTSMQTALREKTVAEAVKMQKGWVKSLKEDKEIGGQSLDKNLSKAKKVINDVFIPLDANFKAMLNSTGLGTYPPFVKGMVQIGAMMSEAGVITGDTATGDETAESVLYGKT